MPQYDARDTVVVFPSERALTVAQIAHHLANSTDSAQATTPADPSTPPPPLNCLRRVVFLEGTWSEAQQMLTHPKLRDLTHVRLDFDAAATDPTVETRLAESESAPSSSSATSSSTSATSSPSTAFWRYQKFGPGFLSSIEAIYWLFRQMQPFEAQMGLSHASSEESASNPAAAASPASSPSSYDNLLWLFAMCYQRLQTYYRNQPTLLTPTQASEGE